MDKHVKDALERAEEFAQEYYGTVDAARAGVALLSFLVGECDHVAVVDGKCSLCDEVVE